MKFLAQGQLLLCTITTTPTALFSSSMSKIAHKRLAKELAELNSKGCPTGCSILQANDLESWIIQLSVLGDTLYEGEVFALRFRFSSSYPIDAPEVTFLVGEGWSAPEHPHLYR